MELLLANLCHLPQVRLQELHHRYKKYTQYKFSQCFASNIYLSVFLSPHGHKKCAFICLQFCPMITLHISETRVTSTRQQKWFTETGQSINTLPPIDTATRALLANTLFLPPSRTHTHTLHAHTHTHSLFVLCLFIFWGVPIKRNSSWYVWPIADFEISQQNLKQHPLKNLFNSGCPSQDKDISVCSASSLKVRESSKCYHWAFDRTKTKWRN